MLLTSLSEYIVQYLDRSDSIDWNVSAAVEGARESVASPCQEAFCA